MTTMPALHNSGPDEVTKSFDDFLTSKNPADLDRANRKAMPLIRAYCRQILQRKTYDAALDLDDFAAVAQIKVSVGLATGKYKKSPSANPWIRKVTDSAVIDILRSKKNPPSHGSLDIQEHLLAGNRTGISNIEKSEIRQRILEAQTLLSPMERSVFEARVHEGLEPPEVASLLGLTCGQVYDAWGRALNKLRERLTDLWEFYHD